MKSIGETETGEVIYNELSCDVCEQMSGPRTRFDNCLNCNATREERVKQGRIKFVKMSLNGLLKCVEIQANTYSKKFPELSIKLDFKIDIT